MTTTHVPTNCPKCKEGALFDVTPRLAEALGQKHVRCDRCGRMTAYVVCPPAFASSNP